MYKKPLVCGIGNMLMGDDGFAQHVLELLERKGIDADLRDFGTAALSVANDLCDYDFVIFIDSISGGEPPGTIYEIEVNAFELMDEAGSENDSPLMFSFSFHDADLKSMLVFAKRIGCFPERVIIIGCEPGSITPTLELSPVVNKAVEKVAARVMEILEENYN